MQNIEAHWDSKLEARRNWVVRTQKIDSLKPNNLYNIYKSVIYVLQTVLYSLVIFGLYLTFHQLVICNIDQTFKNPIMKALI